jgi:hypothetical protein
VRSGEWIESSSPCGVPICNGNVSPGPNVVGVHAIGWTTELSLFASAVGSAGVLWTTVDQDFSSHALIDYPTVRMIVALMLVANSVGEPGWASIFVLVAVIPFAEIGGGISVTHSLILSLLPYRGPIVSTVLGTLL